MLAGKPATNRQPDRHEVVTHVSGTICYLCLRSGQGPTRVLGRTRTMFHNTLVVSSSPTSSTTQSPETGEFLLCRKPLLAGLFVQYGQRRLGPINQFEDILFGQTQHGGGLAIV